ncbi:MAG: hypothetical protein V1916_03605 [Patescibacteria group bacterium]
MVKAAIKVRWWGQALVAGTVFILALWVFIPAANAGYVPFNPGSNYLEAFPNYKVAAIMVTFSDNPAKPAQDSSTQPWTKQYVNGVLFSNTYSVAAYYTEVSGGEVSVSGSVFDNNGAWYTVPRPATVNGDCDWSSYFGDAVAAADADIDFTQYNSIMVFSPQKTCAAEGLATYYAVPEAGSRLYGIIDINGRMGSTPHHELAHLMGLGHANSWQCDAPGIVTGTNCRNVEYGDRYNIMGATGSRTLLLTAQQLENYGWLPAADVVTVSTSNDYTIRAYQSRGTLPRVLKIPQARDSSGNVTSWYYLEYRQPIGFDKVTINYSPTVQQLGVPNGVLVHMGNSTGDRFSSTLLDMTPGSMPGGRDIFEPALPLGYSYSDPAAGVSFGVLSRDANKMTIRVKFNPKSLCILYTPAVSVKELTGTGRPGQELRYEVTVRNRSVLCGKQNYELRTLAGLKGWTVTVDKQKTSVLSIVSGQTRTYDVRVTSPKNSKYQKYALTLEARWTQQPSYKTAVVLRPVIARAK